MSAEPVAAPALLRAPASAPALAGPSALPAAVVAGLAAALAAVALHAPALLALGLLAPLAALLTRRDSVVALFVFVMYLNVPVVMVHAAGLPSALAAAFSMVLLVPLVRQVVLARRPLVITPALPLMVLYLAALVIATAVAGEPTGSASAIVTFIGEGLILYFLVTNAVRRVETLWIAVWALLLAGAATGLVSVWQEFTHSYHTSLAGFAQVNQIGFGVGQGLSGPDVRPRLAGPVGEQNQYARVLLVLIPLGVWMLRSAPTRRKRLVAGAATGLILAGMLLTFSRGAALALVLVIASMVAVGFVRARHVAALAAALLVLVAVVAPDYVTRIKSLGQTQSAISSGSGDGAIRGRAAEGLAALHVLEAHPIVGVGPDQFFLKYSQRYTNAQDLRFVATDRHAHNLYLEIGADSGLLGLGAFLAIVGATLLQLARAARRLAPSSPQLASLAQAFALSVGAYMIAGLFLHLAYQRYFWLLIALANATAWVLRRRAVQ